VESEDGEDFGFCFEYSETLVIPNNVT